jgi:hypothetical protein
MKFCDINRNFTSLSNGDMYLAERNNVNLKLRACTWEYNIDINENKGCL